MTFSFDPREGLVIVRAELAGPSRSVILRLALDTGATETLVNTDMLVLIGYDPAAVPDRVEVTTGSGIESAPYVTVERIVALGQERRGLAVLCHTLPPSAGVDGLLGLDFLRGCTLNVDFREGRMALG